MPLIQSFRRYIAKARSKVRATPARVEALQAQMEEAMTISFTDGAEALRSKVKPEALMSAFKKGDYKPLLAKLPMDRKEITDAFLKTSQDIEGVIAAGGKLAAKEVAKLTDKNFAYDASNPRTAKFVDNFTGELAQRLTDDMKENLRSAVQDNLVNGTPLDQTAQQIRQSIGLNNRQAVALQNFKGTEADRDAYAERLLDQRAAMVARTEVAYAQNEARLQVWDQAQDAGLIGQNATKIWMVDGKPCDICEPMDGQEVSLDEPFTSPEGDEVYAPPLHPRCLCQAILGKTD